MFPSEREILVHREQYEDLLREAALERLIRAAGPPGQPAAGDCTGKPLTGSAPSW